MIYRECLVFFALGHRLCCISLASGGARNRIAKVSNAEALDLSGSSPTENPEQGFMSFSGWQEFECLVTHGTGRIKFCSCDSAERGRQEA